MELVDKIDEVKLQVVEAKASTLEDVDTSTFVAKPHSIFKWALYSGSHLVMEPRYKQHDMLYLGPAFNFELVLDMYGKRCLKVIRRR